MKRALGLVAMLGILVIVFSKRDAITSLANQPDRRQHNLSLRVSSAEKPENLVVVQVTPGGRYQIKDESYDKTEVREVLSAFDAHNTFLEIQPASEAQFETLRQLLVVISECGFEEVSIDWGEESGEPSLSE